MTSVNARALDMIIYPDFDTDKLDTRSYSSPPDILLLRSAQVKCALKAMWSSTASSLGNNNDPVFANNFFLDHPLHERKETLLNLVGGKIEKIDDFIIPLNQLRATFYLTGSNGKKVRALMTLTPTQPPLVQALDLTLEE